jgi:spore maturation protein CgeB
VKIIMVRPGPGFSVADVYQGLARALADLGNQVWDFNLDDRLTTYAQAGKVNDDTGAFTNFFDLDAAVQLASRSLLAACYETRPDLVVVVSGFYIALNALDTIRANGTNVAMVHLESPYEDDTQLIRAQRADLNVINDPTNLDRFKALSPAFYMPHAYDPAIHCPGASPADWASDFCFVGSGFPSRVSFLESVDFDGINVALGGNWLELDPTSPLRKHLAHDIDDCMMNADTVLAYRATKASANLYRREAQRPELAAGWAMGPREVELSAVGTFWLAEERGENREVLPMVPTFDGPGDFGEKLRWYLDRPDLRAEIARGARAAIADRTFKVNAGALLRAVESL